MEKKKILAALGFLLVILISGFVISGSEPGTVCPDKDKDGVCDSNDLCPNSNPIERIDANGCDVFQFCEKFSCGMSCFYGDFLGNEPSKQFPHDCTVVLIVKEGKYTPKCVPIECKKQLTLPLGALQVKLTLGGSGKYSITVYNVSVGSDIFNQVYPAWCVDESDYIINNKIYDAYLYSSYDPDLAIKCPSCYDPDWDKVNYIINHKKGTILDVQAAINYFIDGGNYPADPDAKQMVEDAKIYGSGFWPQEGQNMAIIVYIGEKVQTIFIEVDP